MTDSMTVEHGTPRADCVADSAGGITFDIADVQAAEPVLVLRRRGGSGPSDEARLPLTPSTEGHVRAVLPSTVELAEGRWDAYVGDHPVEPGIRDVRALLDRVPEPGGPVAVRVPYPTAEGRLAVRSWVRHPHAEAGAIAVGEGTCTVEGVLYGAELGPGAVAEARSGERTHQVPARGDGNTFTFTLPYERLAEQPLAQQRLWQLWLRPDTGAEPVRVSRILDDVWDRKNIFVYPEHHGEGYRAAPCYTADNDLGVRVAPVTG
ncbi:hypothetical protein [Streptomyces sp. NPDC047928]|uniref:hypothetical protein n=1 Tax=unclassified Streptomyces TaxID=2593676 RepID=UPI0037226036